MTGEHRNCITAQSATSKPFHKPVAVVDPESSAINCGTTGITIPIDMTSSIAVSKMKTIAAVRGEAGAEDMIAA